MFVVIDEVLGLASLAARFVQTSNAFWDEATTQLAMASIRGWKVVFLALSAFSGTDAPQAQLDPARAQLAFALFIDKAMVQTLVAFFSTITLQTVLQNATAQRAMPRYLINIVSSSSALAAFVSTQTLSALSIK